MDSAPTRNADLTRPALELALILSVILFLVHDLDRSTHFRSPQAGQVRSDARPRLLHRLADWGGGRALFSPDGKRLLTQRAGRVQVWDALSFRAVGPVLQHGDEITSVEFSARGDRVLTSGGPSAMVWEVESGKPVSPRLRHGGDTPVVAAISPDGTRVVTGSSLALNRRLKSGDPETIAKVWDVATGKPLFSLPHESFAFFVTYSPDGSTIGTVNAFGNSATHLWNAADGRELYAPIPHSMDARRPLVFSGNSKAIATIEIYAVAVHRVADGAELFANRDFERENQPLSVALSRDGSTLAVADASGSASVTNVETGRRLEPKFSEGSGARQVALDASGRRLFVQSGATEVEGVWDVSTGLHILPMDFGVTDSGEFSPDGKLLVVSRAEEGDAEVWQMPG